MSDKDPQGQVLEGFRTRFGREPDVVVRAPGRVNILGGHVDYSEGWVLPGAIEQSFWLAASSVSADTFRLIALDLEEEREVPIDPPAPPVSSRTEDEESGWWDYPSGVAWALQRTGAPLPGIEAVMCSEVPIGAGVSSSAALEVAFLTAIETLTGHVLAPVEKAKLGRTVENEYLGVQSGIMDQYASVHGLADTLLLIDCRSLTHEEVPLPEFAQVLVADTGVRRRLQGSSFNDRRSEVEAAVEHLRAELPGIRTLRDVSPEQLAEHRGLLPEPLGRRARHAVEECRRVLAGAQAAREGRIDELGELMKASHRSSRDNYEVTIPELDLLAETAWEVEGCWGARVAGGGFGGCVLSLVHRDATADLERALTSSFRRGFGRAPTFLRTGIARGAEVVD